MKTLSEHITHVKTKPHHVRRRVAFSAAASVTGLIALVWLVGSVSAGAFALKNTSFADNAGGSSIEATSASDNTQNLAGAAAALDDAKAPAHIKIVDTSPATSTGKSAEQTTIPF
jgi:hypothetical protein